MMALETEVTVHPSASRQGVLYREVSAESRRIKARFIPYYAWGNRGRCDMTVWLPLER